MEDLVQLNQISKRYGDTAVLDKLSLDIVPGNHLALLGPSGCGKSTLLRLIAGLEPPDSGTVRVSDRLASVAGEVLIPPHQRGVSIVFQDLGLWPNLTILETVALDFFVVPTLTFRILFVLVILAHDRRRVLHFNVTAHPTAEWTRQQLVEAFPWDSAPRYLLRDRDSIYGAVFKQEARNLDIEEVVTAYRSPWQNPFVERLIGSIRRECTDYIVVLNEVSLRRTLKSYFLYYTHSRTHLALDKDSPNPRAVQSSETGRVVEIPQVSGLHHRYERRAA